MPATLSRLAFAVLALAFVAACGRAADTAVTPYLGMKPPGTHAALFAPGIASTALSERDLAITPHGQEIYWAVSTPGSGFATIVVSRQAKTGWTPPRVAQHMTDPAALHIEPALSADGRQMFFTLVKPDPSGSFADSDIWVMTRGRNGWEKPERLDEAINTDGGEFFASPTRAGTLYFTREPKDGKDAGIYRSRLVGGKYAPAERLPLAVNEGQARFNAFVDRDERYVVVPMQGRPDSLGGVDYYVVFRNEDDTWTAPVNLGTEVNTTGSQEYSPYVSPDGKYFFFMSSRREASPPARLTYKFFADAATRPRNGNADIWWIEAGFIERLRPAAAPAALEFSAAPAQSRHK